MDKKPGPKDAISDALDHDDFYVRRRAVKNKKATAKHLYKALDDKDASIRLHALEHPNIKPEHMAKALNDRDDHVRRAAESMILRKHGIKETVSFSKLKNMIHG